MDKIDKLNKINELKQQQLKLMEKSIKIATLPEPKRPSTSIKRAFRVLALAWECKMMQEQIKHITWQPIAPDFEKDGIIMEGKANGAEQRASNCNLPLVERSTIMIKGTETFEIKTEHLELLKRAFVSWDGCEYGAPAIDCKRPYGNSYVEGDIAEILKWEVDEDGELTDEQYELAEKLHKETQTALQICLVMREFKTGVFRQADVYRDRAWERVQ